MRDVTRFEIIAKLQEVAMRADVGEGYDRLREKIEKIRMGIRRGYLAAPESEKHEWNDLKDRLDEFESKLRHGDDDAKQNLSEFIKHLHS